MRIVSHEPLYSTAAGPISLNEDFLKGGIAAELCQRPGPAPGMTLAEKIVDRGLSPKQMGIATYRLSTEVKNVFQGLV